MRVTQSSSKRSAKTEDIGRYSTAYDVVEYVVHSLTYDDISRGERKEQVKKEKRNSQEFNVEK